MNKNFDISNLSLNIFAVGFSFLIAVIGGVGSYYKSISDIKQQLSEKTLQDQQYFRLIFASKEEIQFINLNVSEIKEDLKDIKSKIK